METLTQNLTPTENTMATPTTPDLTRYRVYCRFTDVCGREITQYHIPRSLAGGDEPRWLLVHPDGYWTTHNGESNRHRRYPRVAYGTFPNFVYKPAFS